MAQQKYDWENSTCTGLRQLVSAVNAGRDATRISDEMKEITLGDYREQVMSAYARFRLADSLAVSATSISSQGVLSGKTVQQRNSERDAAKAALAAVLEQSSFQSRQDCASARLAAQDAKLRLDISRQYLETLLGYDDADENLGATENPTQPLSHVEVRAPFAGTIESCRFSKSERVAQNDTLYVLADTSRLWVTANIREREWPALNLTTGQTLSVTAPAMPGVDMTATIYYVGREVSPLTNAAPLVATIDNADGRLRPGSLFAPCSPCRRRARLWRFPSRPLSNTTVNRLSSCASARTRFNEMTSRSA